MEFSFYSVLFFMFIQDLKIRKIYAFTFPLILILGYINNVSGIQSNGIENFTNNLTYCAILFILLMAYRYFRMPNVLSEFTIGMGAGDIVFIILLCPFFQFQDFILFLSFSLIFTILLFLPSIALKKGFTIPLAGTQALHFGIYVYLVENTEFNFQKLNYFDAF